MASMNSTEGQRTFLLCGARRSTLVGTALSCCFGSQALLSSRQHGTATLFRRSMTGVKIQAHGDYSLWVRQIGWLKFLYEGANLWDQASLQPTLERQPDFCCPKRSAVRNHRLRGKHCDGHGQARLCKPHLGGSHPVGNR
jgi:hypothetical protein